MQVAGESPIVCEGHNKPILQTEPAAPQQIVSTFSSLGYRRLPIVIGGFQRR